MTWSPKAKNSDMLLDIVSPMSDVINDQLGLNVVDICLDNTQQILCKITAMLCKNLED